MKPLTSIALIALSVAYLMWFAVVVVYVTTDPQPGTPLVMLMCSFAVPPCVYALWQSLKTFWPDAPEQADTFS